MIRLSKRLQSLSSLVHCRVGGLPSQKMASAVHLKIPEPVNMVNILKVTKMLFCGGMVQHP